MNDDDAPPSPQELNLQRFLDDLQRKCQDALAHSEEMRRTWHEALKDTAWQRVPSKCPACKNGHTETLLGPDDAELLDRYGWVPGMVRWEFCSWCAGTGSVQIVPERRGIA